MEPFTIKQRVLIVKTFYQNGESATKTARALRAILGRSESPNESTVRRLMTKFKTTGSVATAKSPGRNRSCRTEQQIAIVQDSMTLSPGKSIRQRSQQLGIPVTSLHRILHEDLGHVKFLVDPEEVERHSSISVVCQDDKNYQAHIGFLQLYHRYEVKFPLRLQSPATSFKALPQPSLVVKKFEVEVSSECDAELLVTLELLPHKTKLLREKLVLVGDGEADRVTVTFSARVLGPGQGTPSLLNGVKQISVEPVGDSEASDWQGFD